MCLFPAHVQNVLYQYTSAAVIIYLVAAELTISEIMDLKPKKMVMNSSEKIINRYYEGALGPVENATALFETSKV